MKKFYENSKTPIIVGTVAFVVFCLDSILLKYVWSLADIDRGFVWVAFIVWAVTFGMKNNERVRFWLGNIIGFLAAVAMIYFGQLFELNILGIAVATALGVFLFSGLVMYFDHLKKFWLNSITGIFVGAPLTFSGLGIGLAPTTFADGGLMLGIILLYSLFGCLCAFSSVYFMGKWKKKSE